MHTARRSSSKEIAILNKLDRLPIATRRSKRLVRYDLSRATVLLWYRGVVRQGRRYTMRCEVLDDGSLQVASKPMLGIRRARRVH